MSTLCEKILCLYNLKAKSRSKVSCKNAKLLSTGKVQSAFTLKMDKKAYSMLTISCDEEKHMWHKKNSVHIKHPRLLVHFQEYFINFNINLIIAE